MERADQGSLRRLPPERVRSASHPDVRIALQQPRDPRRHAVRHRQPGRELGDAEHPRLRADVERYVSDMNLVANGQPADPEASLERIHQTANALVAGGEVPAGDLPTHEERAVEGDVDDGAPGVGRHVLGRDREVGRRVVDEHRGPADTALDVANLAVQVWTINTCEEMLRMIDLGVDAIMTDQPLLLESILSTPPDERQCN